MVLGRVRGALVRRGLQTALNAGAQAAVAATSQEFRQAFNVQLPVTAYVRASHCTVTIQRVAGQQITLTAQLGAAFGWEMVTDQDEAGVYIVAKRKPVFGALSWARFTLSVPTGVHLALHLTPGNIELIGIDGQIRLAGNDG